MINYVSRNNKLGMNYLSFLYQKAKASWLNTAYFHASIRARSISNRIFSIKNMDGTWVNEPNEVSDAFLQYYVSLLGTKMDERRAVKSRLIKEGPILSEARRSFLLKEFSEKDVKDALFDITGSKSPGPDGFSSSFFQDNWDVVKRDVCEAVLSFLHTGKLLKELNSMTITLVPKTECPDNVTDFRPISYCNVLYKVATKMICSRLRQILPELVAQNQSCFIQGRCIAYNIMVCQDMMRHYGRENARPNCIIKINLRKAYDTDAQFFLKF